MATESFGGMRVVRAFSKQRAESNRIMRGNHMMGRQELYAWWWTRIIELVWETLIPLASGALLIYGGWRVLEDRLTLGRDDLTNVATLDGDGTPEQFTDGDDGVVRAIKGDKILWQAATGGSVNFPPVQWNNRVYVGSNDGRVYAFEAATGKLLWKNTYAAPE